MSCIKCITKTLSSLWKAAVRDFLIHKISISGGHLASNLGVVELTMAMHLVCDLPKDKMIWDVGHQSYSSIFLYELTNLLIVLKIHFSHYNSVI